MQITLYILYLESFNIVAVIAVVIVLFSEGGAISCLHNRSRTKLTQLQHYTVIQVPH